MNVNVMCATGFKSYGKQNWLPQVTSTGYLNGTGTK